MLPPLVAALQAPRAHPRPHSGRGRRTSILQMRERGPVQELGPGPWSLYLEYYAFFFFLIESTIPHQEGTVYQPWSRWAGFQRICPSYLRPSALKSFQHQGVALPLRTCPTPLRQDMVQSPHQREFLLLGLAKPVSPAWPCNLPGIWPRARPITPLRAEMRRPTLPNARRCCKEALIRQCRIKQFTRHF